MLREFPDEPDNTRPARRLILSFVVRIWLEDGLPGKHPMWRGKIMVIEQVPGAPYAEAPQLAFDDLDRMMLFILKQFEQAGVRVPWRWRVHRYLLGWQRKHLSRRP